jgi:hypothetical protein
MSMAILWLQGLGQLKKNSMTYTGLVLTTFRLVVQIDKFSICDSVDCSGGRL